jgi:Phage portal protein, SPP1 Gp6-like
MMGSLMRGMAAGYLAFREAYLHAEDPRAAASLVGAPGFDPWGRFEARRLRYAIHWAYWQNDAYRNIHMWSKELKALYGLYKHTRPVYNPARRITEFAVCHVYNGSIDPAAGDGSRRPSAIPILMDDVGPKQERAIRDGLATVWRRSHWQAEKSTWIRYGAAMGDAPLAVVDEPPNDGRDGRPQREGGVRLEPWHPGTLKWVDAERDGAVRAYIREEMRPDPEQVRELRNISPTIDPLNGVRTVTYTEQAQLEPGGGVRYKTFRNYAPYNWSDPTAEAEWVAPYPFVPLVLCPHIRIGGHWGMGEFHADEPKIREADDVASKLNDQIRKLVESPWLFAGFKKSDVDFAQLQHAASLKNPEHSREIVPTLYAADASAKAQALVAELPIAEVTAHIQTLLAEIESDHPELRWDRLTVSGELSGVALRKARQGVETKVNERRAEYDHALAGAQEMALVLGGIRGYPGFAPATDRDHIDGKFRHLVGDRTVFGVDALERLEEEQAEATAVQTWTSSGVPLKSALVRVGWTEEDAQAAGDAKDAEDVKKQAAAVEMTRAKSGGPDVKAAGEAKAGDTP